MSMEELRASVLAQVAAVEDEWRLREVERVLAAEEPEAEPLREGEVLTEVDLDRVLGYRPNGEAVTLRKALPEWEAGIEEVRAGGGHSVEEVIAHLAERISDR